MSVENDQVDEQGPDPDDVGAESELPGAEQAPDGASGPVVGDGTGGPPEAPPGHVMLHAVGRVVGTFQPEWSDGVTGEPIPVLAANFVGMSFEACQHWMLKNEEITRKMADDGLLGMFMIALPESQVVAAAAPGAGEARRIISLH